MAGDAGPVDQLEARLGHAFRDRRLLERALTHSSRAREQAGLADNEGLEFLGDALLGFLVAEALFTRHPDLDEGGLSKLKAYLVSRPSLAAAARDLGLADCVQVGKSAAKSRLQANESMLADAFEAILAAVHLDAGEKAARQVVERVLGGRLRALNQDEVERRDPKTRLQEELQATGRPTPRYRVGKTEGPPHRPVFHVDLLVDGEVLAHGKGGTKKEAEQHAAERALRDLTPASAKR
ncbi:MAG TPA: ribonuclease III [Verrucomicrobiae bacterium]|nr:ribonuclease III [Verrucomicrobiae bacterium]